MGVPIIYNYDINSSVFLDSRRSIESLSMLEYISSNNRYCFLPKI